MNYTNSANLPQPLVSAIQYSDYDKVGDISVTGLIQPPRIRQLTIRYRDQLTEDVSEGIWRLIGSIGHKILERADTDNHLAEERITTELHGWTISAKADLLGPDMTLWDYKFRSVWATKDAKPEDEAQVNLYALIYAKNGFVVKAARILSVLRDWSKLRASRESNYPKVDMELITPREREQGYPPVGVVVREVPLWSPEEQEAYLGQRVRAHQTAENLADDDLPMCSPEERWRKPDVWAVVKKGNKRAKKLFETEADAAEMIRAMGGPFDVIKRPGEDTRCLHYCAVREFCLYGRSLTSNEENGEETEGK